MSAHTDDEVLTMTREVIGDRALDAINLAVVGLLTGYIGTASHALKQAAELADDMPNFGSQVEVVAHQTTDLYQMLLQTLAAAYKIDVERHDKEAAT